MTARIGLLGFAGFGAQDHQTAMYLPALEAAAGRARIVAVASTGAGDRERAQQVAGRLGLEVDSPAAVLARNDVDAVVVCAPVAERADLLTRAVDAGKHVLADKPLALTAREVSAVAAAAARHSEVVVGVAHHLRTHPMLGPSVAGLAAGRVGLPWNLQADFLVAGGDPSPDGELRNLGVHPLDVALALLELPVKRAQALRIGPVQPGTGFVLLLEHETGATSTIAVARCSPLLGVEPSGVARNRYRVSGSHGTATIDLTRPALSVHTAALRGPRWTGASTVQRLVDDWLAAVTSGRGTVAGVAEALAVAEVLDAATASLDSGGPEPVAPPDDTTHTDDDALTKENHTR